MMRIKFTYLFKTHVLINCPEKFTLLMKQLDVLYHHTLPENRALIYNENYETSFLIADQEDFDAYTKDLQRFAVANSLNIARPMGQYRYKDKEQYYASIQFDNTNRGNRITKEDLNDLGEDKDEDNVAERFKKGLLEAALTQEDDKAKVGQCSETPSNIHYFTQCNGCRVSPIVGVRYKCTVCPNFSYCEGCYQMFEHCHNFMKMKECDDFDAFKCELKQKKLSVKSAEWMNFDPNADSLVQELFNVRKNALVKNYQEKALKENFVSKDEMKAFNLPQKNEEKQQSSSLEEIERTQIDEKIAGLLEYFPNEDFNKISSFVRGARKDLSFLELRERFQRTRSLAEFL